MYIYMRSVRAFEADRSVTAVSLAQNQVDVALFQECARIGSALVNKQSCTEALAWCGENRGTLKKTKVSLCLVAVFDWDTHDLILSDRTISNSPSVYKNTSSSAARNSRRMLWRMRRNTFRHGKRRTCGRSSRRCHCCSLDKVPTSVSTR